MTITVYHNPESAASCDIIAHIRAQGIEPVIVDVIQNAPTRSELIKILNKTGMSAREILCEREATARGIRKDMPDLTKLLTLMAQNPRLLENAIVVTAQHGRVCKTAAQVEGLIEL